MVAQIVFSSGCISVFAEEVGKTKARSAVEGDTPEIKVDIPGKSDYDVLETEKNNQENAHSNSSDAQAKEREDTQGNSGDTQGKEKESTSEDSQETPKLRALSNEVNVYDWNEFRNAYNDPNVVKINLKADIETTKSTTSKDDGLASRTKSLEINGAKDNGGYYKLQLYGGANRAYLPIGKPREAYDWEDWNYWNYWNYWYDWNYKDYGIQVFEMHDLSISQSDHSYQPEEPTDAFIGSSASSYTENWKFRIGNIDTDNTKNSSIFPVNRVVFAKCSDITFYGDVHLSPRAEVGLVGSVKFEDNTNFTAKVQREDVSCFWFRGDSKGTGSNHEFTVGENAYVKLETADNKDTYPPIYRNFSTITVGKDSKLYCLADGNALRFQRNLDQKLIVNEGATLGLRSNNKSVIDMQAYKSSITAQPGSKVYLYSNSKKDEVVNMKSGSTNTITLDKPAEFDIVITGGGNVFGGMSGADSFNINGVGVFAWNKKDDIKGNPTDCFDYSNNIQITKNTNVYSDNSDVAKNLKPNDRHRISGGNFDPVIIYGNVPDECNHVDKLTDADKPIRARVRVGQFPKVDDSATIGENMEIQDVYATENLFKNAVIIENSLDLKPYKVNIDKDGYLKYNADKFYPAETHFKTTIDRSNINGKSNVVAETDVIDITPPEPAKVTTGPLKPTTRTINGVDGEVGAMVKVKYFGAYMQKDGNDCTATVDQDGKWKLDLPDVSLEVGKYLTIYMSDASGNTNPDADTKVHDAMFKKATSVPISGTLELTEIPDEINFGTMELQLGTAIEKWAVHTGALAVVDTRIQKNEWQLSARMFKELTDNNDESRVIEEVVCYYDNGTKYILNKNNSIVINRHKNYDSNEYVVSNKWSTNNDGIKLEVPATKLRVGHYSGEIEWTLQDVPSVN
jgi:hypothetical protein